MTYLFSSDAFWIKCCGLMLWAKRSPPLFSERHGYEWFVNLPFTKWGIQLKVSTKQTKGANNQ